MTPDGTSTRTPSSDAVTPQGQPPPAPPVPPAARVMSATLGAWVAQAVSAAATIKVADHLDTEPRPVAEVAKAVGADPDALCRLLRVLAEAGLVEEHGGRRFSSTETSDLLRSDVPDSLRDWAVFNGSRFHLEAWSDLATSVRTGEPAFKRVHGQDGFDYGRDHPDAGALINAAMTAASAGQAAPMVASYDFGGLDTVVDVGGGHGALLAGVLQTHPHLRGVVFDLPHVVVDADSRLLEAGVAERATAVGGDFFEAVPPGGDVYLLANIVHDWDDERALQILANCTTALRDGGRVLLAEAVLPEEPGPSPALLIDLAMLVMGTGRQRTLSEYHDLFARAGLRLARVDPQARPPVTLNLLEAVRD